MNVDDRLSPRAAKASCPRVPQVLVWSAAIPDERAVGQL